MSRSAEFAEGHAPLSDRDVQMLDFESNWWKYAGAKEEAIRTKFDVSATRYYQRLNSLADNPASMAHDNGRYAPVVSRIKRLRERPRS